MDAQEREAAIFLPLADIAFATGYIITLKIMY